MRSATTLRMGRRASKTQDYEDVDALSALRQEQLRIERIEMHLCSVQTIWIWDNFGPETNSSLVCSKRHLLFIRNSLSYLCFDQNIQEGRNRTTSKPTEYFCQCFYARKSTESTLILEKAWGFLIEECYNFQLMDLV